MALNHDVQGSVNYTTVGTPTIVNGVASGFSDSDYLSLINQQQISDITDFESVIKFTTNTINIRQGLGGKTDGFGGCYISTSNQLRVIVVDFINKKFLDAGTGLYISSNTTYYVKNIFRDGKTYYSYSQDGINYTTSEVSATNDLPENVTTLNNYRFGYSYQGAFTGSIDLNQTYIKVNGAAWFGNCPVEVKHINYGTTVGYTKVGSPTIVNGVASGFSSSNYVQLAAENHPTIAGAKYELFIKFTTPATVARNGICGSSYSYAQGGVWIDGAKKLVSNVTTNVSTRNLYFSSSALTGSTTYYAHLILDSINNDYRALLSTDKTNWTTTYLTLEEGETISSQPITSVFRFGYNGSSAGGQFDGSIDLNETYIKVNGKLWLYRPCTNYVAKDDKLVFADSGLYLTGPVNYTVVGSPAIVDNAVSGFNSNNYINIISATSIKSKDVTEIGIKIFNKRTTEGGAVLLTTVDSQSISLGCNNKSVWATLYNTTAGAVQIGGLLSGNAPFGQYSWIKIIFDGTTCSVYHSSTGYNDMTLTASGSYSYGDTTSYNSIKIGADLGSNDEGTKVDLNETYIKVNGSLWFYGKNYASQNIAPVPSGYHFVDSKVGLVKEGSPTIVDGVVSGFSNSDYLRIPSVFSPGSSTWEIMTKVNCTPGGAASYIMSRYTTSYRQIGFAIGTSTTPEFTLSLSSNGNAYDITENTHGTFQVQSGVNYFVSLKFTGTQYILSYSTDGVNFIEDIVVNSTTPIYNENALLAIGVNRYTTSGNIQPFRGSIDLNETYIKVNNAMWFNGAKAAAGVGYFDMRTQKFIGAPAGATLGKDE